MAQRDKVKELVGRGLNSYHTKALQQIDRIEKKNKEQNHKISILSNELDNDYLTKTEEGSVISLEHSKEGMVYLDELQGNTLVNYCTDGSKELTLNGDIDLEGTFVTTTEGVDGGKIDVMCEGNTLVNLKYGSDGYDCNIAWANSGTIEYFNRQEYSKIHCKGEIVETANILGISWIYHVMGQVKLHLLKPNTTYTIKLNNKHDCITSILIQAGNATSSYIKSYQKIDKDTYLIITKDSFEELSTNSIILYGTLSKDYKGSVDYKIIGMFEGDWSNKELPNDFFEGMKSVGQDDENGHKIEILSQNNLIQSDFRQWTKYSGEYQISEDGREFTVSYGDTWNAGLRIHNVTLKKGTYYLGYTSNNMSSATIFVGSKEIRVSQNRIFTIEEDVVNATFAFRNGTYNGGYTIRDIYITKDVDLGFSITKSNKKEILLNEPLRGLPNGVRDRFVKIGGKSYIERNCGEVVLDGSDDETYGNAQNTDGISYRQSYLITPYAKFTGDSLMSLVVSDRLPTQTFSHCYTGEKKGVSIWGNSTPNGTHLVISNGFNNADELRNWLKSNPLTVVYQLITPIYEPLEVEPTLNTYNDVTHISNNSIIPCNMKVKNSGYNAIIKPNTLYTVALDTNKSGTIGMNLGGAKGTTTNNVLTLTTPATLTDDSLRLYGKGIKGSKVRILEGDKTNWIPSHFEGMKSSFEDKFDDTDNTYKMEILSNNKNYFNYKGELNQYYKGMSIGTEVNINTLQSDGGISSNLFTANHHGRGQIIKVKPYTSYIIKSTVVNSGRININTPSMVNFEYGAATNGKLNKTFNTLNNNEICLSFHTYGNPSNPNAIFYDVELILESNDNLDYIPNKSNKIQFSSIEPLRKWDRFVFVNGKLMIERNTKVKNFMPTTIANTPLETYQLVRMSKTSDMYGYNNGYGNWTMMDKYSEFTALGDTWQLVERIGQYSTRISSSVVDIAFSLGSFNTLNDAKNYFTSNPAKLVYRTSEPTYEEIPFELQKIILEGYENGTLFFDTNIPPTSTVTYAGETPIVKSVRLNKTEVLNNTVDINDNIVPYLMDMDYRVVCLQLQSENTNDGVSMARLFGGAYEMLQRDIQSKRYSIDEYRHRLDAYLGANKITEDEYNKLGDMLNE